MKIQILVVLIFTVFCFSKLNAESDSLDSAIEGRAIDDIAKSISATESNENLSVANEILKIIQNLLKDLENFLKKLFSLSGNENDVLGVLSLIIKKVVELLNEILPEHIDISIISIKFIRNVIIIEIGKTDSLDPIPVDPPTPPTPVKTYLDNYPVSYPNPNAYNSYNPYPVQSSYSYSQ